MNARIIKETRSLLPAFCVMVLACAAPRLIWSPETAARAGLGIFTICCLTLGASCFGNEFQWRTMPLLLAQPLPRRKIWNEKMLVLGAALGLGLILFLLCIHLPERDSYLFLVLVPFCVLCTAPYMALRIKNTLVAVGCTFAFPLGITGALNLLVWMFSRAFPVAGQGLENSIENHAYACAVAAAAAYCGALYWLGYRTFIKLEAIDSQAKEITLPPRMEAILARPLARLMPRYSGPWASLLRKELQIQKAAFVLAGVMCLVSILMALAWDVDHAELLAAMSAIPIVVLAFVVPMIVSGGCVAEERSWGVSEWQRALPVSARKQWAAKMLVVFTSVLLGVVVPAVLWLTDGWVFQLPNGARSLHFNAPTTPEELMAFLSSFVLVYLLMLGLGVFTSSLCANSAKAIIMNLGLLIASGSIAGSIISGVATPTETHYHYVFRLRHPMVPMVLPNGKTAYMAEAAPSTMGFAEEHVHVTWVVLGILLSLLLVLVLYLGYSNYRKGEPSSRSVWRQLATVTGAVVTSAVVYWALLYWNMVGMLFSSH